MSEETLPEGIDEPQQVLLWTIDEAIPLVGMFVIGFIMEQIILFTAIGFLFSKLVRKYKDIRPDGFMAHTLWYWGIGAVKGHTMLNPFKRSFRQ